MSSMLCVDGTTKKQGRSGTAFFIGLSLAFLPAVALANSGAMPIIAPKVDGKEIYDAFCAACHASGAGGAPRLDDKAAWAPRLRLGVDAMVAATIKGRGNMPPKGGNSNLQYEEIAAAVSYMASRAR